MLFESVVVKGFDVSCVGWLGDGGPKGVGRLAYFISPLSFVAFQSELAAHFDDTFGRERRHRNHEHSTISRRDQITETAFASVVPRSGK